VNSPAASERVTASSLTGWWVPGKNKDRLKSRWVLGVIGGKVCYSKGGTAHSYCKEDSFLKWAKRTQAKQESRQ